MTRAALPLLLLLLLTVPIAAQRVPGKKLVVVIVVDQMRQDQLQAYREHFLPAENGGFLRLASGIEHARAFHDHHPMHTATGHSSLATGALPSVHGVVGNRWLRAGRDRAVDAGVDPEFPLVGGRPGAPGGFSPRDQRAPNLGDTLKRASGGRSQVVTVALKDRTAVLLAGYSADVALWFDEGSGNWVSSRYYSPDGALLPFAARWNETRHPDRDFARLWTPQLSPSPAPAMTAGDSELAGVVQNYVGLSATFPHRIDGGNPEAPGPSFYEAWAHTPWAVHANVSLALEAIDFCAMGRDEHPDLLYLGLGALDKVGHVFGPDSPEALEMLLEIDRGLATLLDGLDQRVGLDNCLIALSSDHGVNPLAEHLREFRTPAGRLPLVEFRQRLVTRLGHRWPPSAYSLVIADPHIFISPATGLEQEKPAMIAALKEELQATEGVWGVFESERLASGQHRDLVWESRLARSVYPGRSGDLLMVTEPNHILGFSLPGGTNHGPPWTDDSHVPLLMHGWPQRGRVEARTCAPRQMVSTICLALGLTPPGGCDAPPLPWAEEALR